MNKRFYNCLAASLMAAAGLLCACSENEAIGQAEALQDIQAELAATGGDLTQGWNVMIWGADTLSQCEIPLGVSQEMKVTTRSGLLSMQQTVNAEGKPVLRPVLNREISDHEAVKLHIAVADQPSVAKDVIVVLHPAAVTRLSNDNPSQDREDRIRARARQVLGYAISPSGDIGSLSTYPVFQIDSLADNYTLISDIQSQISSYEEHKGTSIEQINKSFATNLGLSGTFPVKAFMVSVGIGASIEKHTMNRNVFEYLEGTQRDRIANIALDWDAMSRYDEDNIPFFYQLLSKSFNNAANNPSSQEYKNYPLTEEGTYAFLQNYGAYIVKQATLGGIGTFVYTREQQIHSTSIEWDFSLQAKLAKKKLEDSDPSTVDTTKLNLLLKIQELRGGKESDCGGDINFKVGEKSEEYFETCKSSFFDEYKGGRRTGTGIGLNWSINYDKPEEWVVVDFQGTKLINDPLVPIDSMIYEPTRRALIREALALYKDENSGEMTCKYVEYLCRQKKVKSEAKLVVADFFMKWEEGDDSEWAPFVAEGPDHKKRMYYCLEANAYCPDKKYRGYALTMTTGEFAKCVRRGNQRYYYAMDFDDQCNGIIDIKVEENDDAPSGYVRRGDHSGRGIKASTNDNYTFLKLGGKNTRYEDKIKGVGIYAYDGDSKGKVFASTPLADYPVPFTDERKQMFDKYWANGGVQSRCVMYVHWVYQPTLYRIIYSKKALPEPYAFFPDKFGEYDMSEIFKESIPVKQNP